MTDCDCTDIYTDFYCCVQHVSASLERFPGRMYISIDAVYFYGHLFGRTRTFHIPFGGARLLMSNSDGSRNIRIFTGASSSLFVMYSNKNICIYYLMSSGQ